MGEIIHVDFRNRRILESKLPPHSVMSYLQQCREVLVDEDYRELVAAIVDPAIYATSDSDIQKLVDGYFAQAINT